MYTKQNARFSGCGIFLGIIRLTITNFVTTKNPIQMQEIPGRLYRTAKIVKIPILYWESLNGWQVCICDLLLINYNNKINGS